MITTEAPEILGIPQSRLQGIQDAMRSYIDRGRIAGISTLVAYKRKVIHFGCYGSLDVEAGVPIQPDSLFRIYSLTKPVFSVAALMLHEQGLLPLDRPVFEWIPAFKDLQVWHKGVADGEPHQPLDRDITVWHLFTHTSGLAYGIGDPTNPVDRQVKDAKLVKPPGKIMYALPEFVRRLARLPLFAQPGTTWHYGFNHDVLGHLIEIITGRPCTDFLRSHLFEPLGMDDTGFSVPPDNRSRFGPLYLYSDEDGLQVFDPPAASPFIEPDAIPSGGAGLVSSMPDYYRFMAMLANYGSLEGIRILQKKTVKMMVTNQLHGPTFPVRFDDPWPGMGYGLGIGVQTLERSQVGWIGVSGTTAWWYPHDDLILIAMPQMRYDWEASDHFLQEAQGALLG